MQVGIEVNNLSKCYRLGVIGRKTLAEEVRYWWLKSTGRRPADHMGRMSDSPHEGRLATQMDPERPGWFWALRDATFRVEPGEVLGIIGSNGAGKSTLLKILARITEPTRGHARIVGRVSALLEVGTGFHPELTGGENVFVNGAILGMTKQEIRRKFDAIIDFADMDDFVDTPVKRYSSGMRTRLAFAVAAHLEPDVLLVDEVLAVGDAEFQKKCADKMKSLAGNGRTVLFVSHRLASVSQLCTRAIWVDHGRIRASGATDEVVESYLAAATAHGGEARWAEGMTDPRLSGVIVHGLRLCNHRGETTAAWLEHQPFHFEIDYELTETLPSFRLGFMIAAHSGPPLVVSMQEPDPALAGPGRHVVRAEIPGGRIVAGRRQITALAEIPSKDRALPLGSPLVFDIESASPTRIQRGIINILTDWTAVEPASVPVRPR